MRLLLTTDTVGGVWTYTQELCEGFLAQQRSPLDPEPHVVFLASLGPSPSVEHFAWATAVATRYPGRFTFAPVATPLEWQTDNAAAYTGAEPALLAIATDFQPDLLHSSQFCFGALPLSIPRVVVAHSDVLSWADATRPHGLEQSPWLTQYSAQVQRGLSAASCVIAPTRAMLSALARHFTLPARQAVVPNGRTLPSSLPPPPERKLQAVTAGRLWDEAKNVTILEQIDTPLPILLAGERSSSSSFSHASLHSFGHLAKAELLHLFRQSALYLCTSLYEPFGLAPLEAALCGCAILANDIPSLREVWGEAALFFQDAPSLERLLRSLVADPAALLTAQHRAHKRATVFSSHATTSTTLALFRELLNSNAGTTHAA